MTWADKLLSARGFLYLVGEPGLPNYGDDLIASQWLRYYRRHQPTRPIAVDAMEAGRAASYLWRFHPRVFVTDTLARIASGRQFWPPTNEAYEAQWILNDLNSSARRPEFSAGLNFLHHAVDAVHVMGGGYISGEFPGTLGRALILPWARGRGLPAVATGLGVTPVRDAQARLLQEALSGPRVAVRDAPSQALLPEATLLPDDVFVNGLAGVYRRPPAGVKYWVAIQADMWTEEPEELFAHVVAVLTRWGARRGDRIGVVECFPRVDGAVAQALEAAGFATAFFPILDLLLKGFPAGEGQVWLSTRYHAHLLAAFAGARGAFLTVDEGYYSPKHEVVRRLGSGWTRTAIGGDIPEPGPGVAHARDRSRDYARQIRAFLSS
jgi:hypothetical protein